MAATLLNEAYRKNRGETGVQIYARLANYKKIVEVLPVYRLDGSVERYNVQDETGARWHAYPSDLIFYVFTDRELTEQIRLENMR